uniref:dual specificity protein phosphatase 6-like n=1 Tax=Styela clava TaxID=7725 RepID=UPI001939D3D5|nr:dual specificity protein phosphatase 6-like [Styela clava]
MHLTTSAKSNNLCYKGTESLRDELYRGDDVLLLDCRGNEEYRSGHIKGAYNIILPQLMLRRLKANKLPLKNLVPPTLKQEKEAFLAKTSTHLVIIYDQYSNEVNSNESDLPILLHNRMSHEGCRVAILKGGYSRFHADHPEFCSNVNESQMNDDADDEDGNSSSGSHSADDSSQRSPTNGRCQPPVLGLGALRLCDPSPPQPIAVASPKLANIEGGGLLARRSRRNGRKIPAPLTINSEGESENTNSTASSASEVAPSNTPLSSSCPEQKPCHKFLTKLPNTNSSTSPSSFPTYGNATAPVEILPSLFLGCARDSASAEILAEYNITYILNVTPNLPNVFEKDPNYHYKQIAISDHWSQNLSQFFPEAISFIDEARSKNCGVLVHCLAGISRSATVTVAYLMQKNNWSLNDAYDFVKQRKNNVSPNFNFMGQLLDFEKTLGVCQEAVDSGISSSSSSNSPPTLFFTSPPPPTPSALPVCTSNGVMSSCASGSGSAHKEHRSVFCLPTPMS